MKGLKFLAACAAVGAVSVACAAASFAAEWATYVPATDKEPGKATITIPADYVTAVGSGDFTLLILNKDEPNITEQNKGCVVQIQQGKAADIASVTVGDLKPGKYFVRVGGANVSESNPNGFVATTMTINDAGEVDQVLIGDANGDGKITSADCTEIVKNIAEFESTIDESAVNRAAAAYCTGDGKITSADCTEIVKNIAEFESTIDESAVNRAAAAYCTGDGKITSADCTEIVKNIAEFEVDYVGKTVDLGTYDTVTE